VVSARHVTCRAVPASSSTGASWIASYSPVIVSWRSAGPGRFTTALAGLGARMVVTGFSPMRLGLNRTHVGRTPAEEPVVLSTGPRVGREAVRCCLSLALMTDGLYVVAVRIAHEGSEIVRMVLGPQARLVKYLSTAGDRGIEKRSYRPAIGCGERDMRLAKALPGDLVANPELGLRRWSVADCRSEVHDPLAPQRSQDFVVEARAGTHVGALDGEMVEHRAIMAHKPRRRLTGCLISRARRTFLAFSAAIQARSGSHSKQGPEPGSPIQGQPQDSLTSTEIGVELELVPVAECLGLSRSPIGSRSAAACRSRATSVMVNFCGPRICRLRLRAVGSVTTSVTSADTKFWGTSPPPRITGRPLRAADWASRSTRESRNADAGTIVCGHVGGFDVPRERINHASPATLGDRRSRRAPRRHGW
jgi:hypothetical protein